MCNVLIEGRRGLGKSTLAEWKARALNRNVLFFDPNNQFRHATIRTSDIKEVEDALENSQDENSPPLSLAFVLSIPHDGRDASEWVEMQWNRFARTIWNYGDYALIVDEAHRLQKPQYVNSWLDIFMRQAPRRERNDENPIDIIQTFHRPTDVNGIVVGLADEVYCFRQTKERDLENLEKEYGPEMVEAVKSLRTPQTDPPGRDVAHYFVDAERLEVITDSQSWYVDIRKPVETESKPDWKISKLEGLYGER